MRSTTREHPNGPHVLVIVVDMWLTGSALAMHTMYVDKPMKAQADARRRAREAYAQGEAGRSGASRPAGASVLRSLRSALRRKTLSP